MCTHFLFFSMNICIFCHWYIFTIYNTSVLLCNFKIWSVVKLLFCMFYVSYILIAYSICILLWCNCWFIMDICPVIFIKLLYLFISYVLCSLIIHWTLIIIIIISIAITISHKFIFHFIILQLLYNRYIIVYYFIWINMSIFLVILNIKFYLIWKPLLLGIMYISFYILFVSPWIFVHSCALLCSLFHQMCLFLRFY